MKYIVVEKETQNEVFFGNKSDCEKKVQKSKKDYEIQEYPWYHLTEVNDEVVLIDTGDHTNDRPLIIPGMKRHTPDQLKTIRAREKYPGIYGIFDKREISEIEGWE